MIYSGQVLLFNTSLKKHFGHLRRSGSILFLCAAAKWESEDEFESVSQVTGPVSLFEFVKQYFICVLWLMISYVYYGPNYIQSNIMVDDFICVL